MTRHRLARLAIILGVLGLSSIALAQVSTNFDLSWHLLSGGGSSKSSSNYQVDDSLGQWAAGSSSSTGYQVESGFWTRADVPAGERELYLPLAIRN